MIEKPRYETCCLQTGIETQVTETGQQLPPSYIYLYPIFTNLLTYWDVGYPLWTAIHFVGVYI